MQWHEAYERLNEYARKHPCVPPLPPKPLILAGWAYTNDVEKMRRWEEMIRWVTNNGCFDLLSGISESDFYYTEEPTSHMVGPLGGPMYRPWDFKKKNRPSSDVIAKSMETLSTQWPEIVGPELSTITWPIAFTGGKARRLLVLATGSTRPPWGGWSSLSHVESERRVFTQLHAAINKAIFPHEIDHIDFIVTEDAAEQGGAPDAQAPR